MKLIVGLGNPGEKYKKTRHNLGFMVINELIKDSQFNLLKKEINQKFKAEIIKGKINQNQLVLIKPQIFMNLSGEAVKKVINYYKINLENLWVILDDINLPLGCLRIKTKGSSGGHNGLESIIKELGSNQFVRFRLGIDRDTKIPTEKYVLQNFSSQELPLVKKMIKKTKEAIIFALKNGINKTMNQYNQKEEV